MNNPVVIYARFSPRRNENEAESNDTQIHYCKEYCEKKEYHVMKSFQDKAVSGADFEKPGLERAINYLKRGWVLVVYKRDRLARDVLLSELVKRRVEAKGCAIEAVTGDVEGEGPYINMVRQVLAAVAELERKMISERTKHAMQRHQQAGRLMGRFPPYGTRIDPDNPKYLLPDEKEQKAINEIRELRMKHKLNPLNPELSTSSIVRILNQTIPELARSGKWNKVTVGKIIKRENL